MSMPIAAAPLPAGPVSGPALSGLSPDREAQMRAAARDLEAAFLSEMLQASGVGRPVEGFGGGGPGEEQFTSFLVAEHARAIAARGGIGLAEHIFQSLARREGGA